MVDKAESGSWINGLKFKPKDVNVKRFFVCATDLEGEYVIAMTGLIAAGALVAEGFKVKNLRMFDDDGYRSCGECDADCSPETLEVNGELRVVFACPEHGLHTVIDPFEGQR